MAFRCTDGEFKKKGVHGKTVVMTDQRGRDSEGNVIEAPSFDDDAAAALGGGSTAAHPAPTPGFDVGIDQAALAELLKSYVWSSVIGCLNPPMFGALTAARYLTAGDSSSAIICSYTTIAGAACDAPSFALPRPQCTVRPRKSVVYVQDMMSVSKSPPR